MICKKYIRVVGASGPVLICYLLPDKLITDKYLNKDNHDALSRLIINNRYTKRFTRMELICIVMKQEELQDKVLHCVKIWVQVEIEVLDALVFE